MPPHKVYIEPFLGGGAVLKHKRPAEESIGIDLDPAVIEGWRGRQSCSTVINGDGIHWLASHEFTGDELVYCDPPYLMSTRRGGRIYEHEMTDADHLRLLDVLHFLPCRAMVSGYWSELYAHRLRSWSSLSFQAVTRGGTVATEYVWFNYPEPDELHDYRFLGKDFRERERINRQQRRWVARLKRMDRLQRQALLSAIEVSIAPRRK